MFFMGATRIGRPLCLMKSFLLTSLGFVLFLGFVIFCGIQSLLFDTQNDLSQEDLDCPDDSFRD